MQFRDVIGQSAVKERLVANSREGRVGHALLFAGPPGSGILPMARAFAQYLNCENPGNSDSCGVCGSCSRSSKMIHPDISYTYPVVTGIVTKPKSVDFVSDWRSAMLPTPYMDLNGWVDVLTGGDSKTKQGIIPVEEAQEIIHKLSLKSFEGRYKVFIIWMPEKMAPQAANKLLKSLEEPPADTVFILATESRDQLLVTILSRTQLVRLNRLDDDEITKGLIERFGLPGQEAADMARLADGSFSAALELAGREIGGGSYEEEFLNWMRLCFNPLKVMDKLLAWVDGMAEDSREHQKQFLMANLQILRECLLMNVADGPLVRMEAAQQEPIRKFLPFVSLNNVDEFAAAISEAVYHLERNAHAKILFLDLSLKISTILQKK